MRVLVVTPPAPIVTWEEADEHLHLDGNEEERAYVESLIAGATAHIDGPDGWLGRSIGQQVLEARFSTIGAAVVRLPFPPVISLVGIKYLDVDGSEQTANLSDFALYGDEIEPASANWVWYRSSQREAARVQYQAGYAEVPPAIRAAILMMVGDLYRFRETIGEGGSAGAAMPITTSVQNLLMPFRKWH